MSCQKCNGSGRIRVYNHVQGGVCFRCEGSGVEPDLIKEKISASKIKTTNSIEENSFPVYASSKQLQKESRRSHSQSTSIERLKISLAAVYNSVKSWESRGNTELADQQRERGRVYWAKLKSLGVIVPVDEIVEIASTLLKRK